MEGGGEQRMDRREEGSRREGGVCITGLTRAQSD